MNDKSPYTPREEALAAILETSAAGPQEIKGATWERLISIAWDNRSHLGDRREIRREIRSILVQSSSIEEGPSAAN